MGRRRRRRRVSRRKARPAPKKRKKLTNKKTPRRSVKKRVVNKKTPKYRSRKEGLKANQKRIANKKKTESKKTRPSRRRNVGKAAPPPKKRTPPTNNKTPKYRSRKEGLDANRKRIEAKKTVAPKSRDQKMRDAARKRHENFKKTRVQTFGGTRKNYSKREAEKIRDAGLNFSKVTGGAKNPLARPPINPNIKPGELMPEVQSFVDSVGLTDLSKNAYPNAFNQTFDTSLPSIGQLAKTDLSGFAKSVGANKRISGSLGSRKAFSARPDSNLNMRDLFQAKDLGNMTTNAINTVVDKIPIIGKKLPNLRPMSMTDRDRQKYLGYNPNKPSGYLKQQERNIGGKGSKSSIIDAPPPLPSELIEETQPTTDIGRDQSGTDSNDLTRIQSQAYNTALTNNIAGLGGDFDFGPQGSQMSISEAPGLQAGMSRGRRRIRRFGRGRRRGAGDSFRRGGRRIQEFKSTQLNI